MDGDRVPSVSNEIAVTRSDGLIPRRAAEARTAATNSERSAMTSAPLILVMITALAAAWRVAHYLATMIFDFGWIWGLTACALHYCASFVMDRYRL
jgi:hypothetical protein